jgi:hypothetical protein
MATMERPEGSRVAVRSGWGDVFASTAKTALVAFVVLQIKELVDAGALDTKATAVDAVLIAVGMFLVNAVLKWANG